MKQALFFACIFLLNGLFAQEFLFKPGQEVFTFGDRVKLRSGADVGSEVLTLLPIGTSVEVLEKMEATYPYNGFETPWYKVQSQGKTGYIVGGLLTKHQVEHEGQVFLLSAKRSESDFFLLVRALFEEGSYTEISFSGNYYPGELRKHRLSDGLGLTGVQNVLYINRFGESCGDGGGYQVVFFDGKALFHVLSVQEFADIGSSQETSLIFPAHHDNGPDVVLMRISSSEEELTEEFEAVKDGAFTTCTTTRILRWNGKELLGKKE